MRIFILPLFLISQLSTAKAMFIHEDSTSIYKEEILVPGEKAIWVPVNFNDDNLLKNIPDSLKDLSILRIDLVYTVYKLNPDFKQDELNQNRINELQTTWPATSGDLISWKTIGQTSAHNAIEAKKLFHGFVIYYRPTPTKESIDAEISFMDDFLGIRSVGSDIVNEDVAESPHEDIVTPIVEPEKTSVLFSSDEKFESSMISLGGVSCYDLHTTVRTSTKTGIKELVDSISALPDFLGSTYGSPSHWDGIKKKTITITWLTRSDSCDTTEPVLEHGATISFALVSPTWMQNADYGVVEAVFKRYPQWTNSLIVMDVTGSMSPYIAKTMAWIKESQKSDQVHAFVFFNDGNSTPDRLKKTGHVGGVYSSLNSGFDVVYNQMKSTMQKGGGGDCPENNVEATLEGIKLYPEAKEIVMVADNWATPRDLELVKDLNRPVHVIICGAAIGVNLAYIQLAYDTGGSIHTIEDDMEMRGIEPGKSFKLGNSFYTPVNGRIMKAENK